MLYFLIILVAIFESNCNSKCVNSEFSTYICNSITDIKIAGQQFTWNELELRNSLGEKECIEAKLFSKIQFLNKLVFNNSVNYIEYKAFEGLRNLKILEFVHCDLPVIQSYWLQNVSSIRRLNVSASKVTELEPAYFEKSTKIYEVIIEKNFISRIRAQVFSNTNMTFLELNDNGIKYIEENAFTNMPKLEVLILSGNFLSSFNSKVIMGTTGSELRMLWLNNNTIKYLYSHNFDIFPNLRVLLLFQNQIESIQDGAFFGLTLLRYLDVSNNYLETFPVEAVPSTGLEISRLFLQNNRLNYLSTNLFKKLLNLKFITIGGNPWQCSCYRKLSVALSSNSVNILCDKEYLDGHRPVCIFPDANDDKCLEIVPNATNLYERFRRSSDQYEKLKPICTSPCDQIGSPYYVDEYEAFITLKCLTNILIYWLT